MDFKLTDFLIINKLYVTFSSVSQESLCSDRRPSGTKHTLYWWPVFKQTHSQYRWLICCSQRDVIWCFLVNFIHTKQPCFLSALIILSKTADRSVINMLKQQGSWVSSMTQSEMTLPLCAGPDGGHTPPGSGARQGELCRRGDQPDEQTGRRLAAPNAAQAAQHSLGKRLPATQRTEKEVRASDMWRVFSGNRNSNFSNE